MLCWFTRLDPKTHRFVVERDPHTRIDLVYETRSLLLHDLTHYAVERTRQTDAGFYGHLARGTSIGALRDELEGEAYRAMMEIEREVAMLQTQFKRNVAEGHPAYPQLRSAWGAWLACKQGESLVLPWPTGEIRVKSP